MIEILEPIEAKSIPIGMGNDPISKDEYDQSLKNLLTLYDDVKHRAKHLVYDHEIRRYVRKLTFWVGTRRSMGNSIGDVDVYVSVRYVRNCALSGKEIPPVCR